MEDIKFELIVCIVNAGFSQNVMDAARAAGARGGTIIRGRGSANPEAEEFFNITEDYSPSQYTCHWTVDTHQFADNMTAIGVIQIDGGHVISDRTEGYFSHDSE